MVFQVESRELDPFMNLSNSNQQLKSLTASTCEVIVAAVKSAPNSSGKTDKPDPSWIAADPYLQVDEPVVRQWVDSLLQEDTKGPAIVRLTKGVFRRIAKNPESKQFATPSRSSKSPKGIRPNMRYSSRPQPASKVFPRGSSSGCWPTDNHRLRLKPRQTERYRGGVWSSTCGPKSG